MYINTYSVYIFKSLNQNMPPSMRKTYRQRLQNVLCKCSHTVFVIRFICSSMVPESASLSAMLSISSLSQPTTTRASLKHGTNH